MSQPHPSPHAALGPWALPLPQSRADCLLLFAFRRMATLGLRDATAGLMMVELSGAQFRRQTVLLRAFVQELSFASQGPIKFARCCTPAMTEDEKRILKVLKTAADDPDEAGRMLARLTNSPQICEVLGAAVVFAKAAAGAAGYSLSSTTEPQPVPSAK